MRLTRRHPRSKWRQPFTCFIGPEKQETKTQAAPNNPKPTSNSAIGLEGGKRLKKEKKRLKKEKRAWGVGVTP
jgi:hypothetical protein